MSLKIAFASCMDAERNAEQSAWSALQQQQPDVLLLLGDTVYMDWGLASLARVPAAKREWQSNKSKALEAFAHELHARYRDQWRVPSFQALVRSMPKPRQIFLAWDDHDFAWNNAYGMESDDRHAPERLNDKTVPDAFKRIALGLRAQFEATLRDAETDAPYSAAYGPLPEPASFTELPDAIAPVDLSFAQARLLVLDQRWCRTHRDAKNARVISEPDARLLRDAAGGPGSGLLIVAGSSPLKHHSVFGTHDAWWAPPDAEKTGHHEDRAYPEYALMRSARCPILYLSGNIHRNAYGGWVEDDIPGRTRAPVVQALSSGAGLGRLFFHEYPGSFGLVSIDGTAHDASVALRWYAEGHKVPDERHLQIADGQWSQVTEGECTNEKLSTDADALLHATIDHEPLAVLSYRARGKRLRDDDRPLLRYDELDAEGYTGALLAVPNLGPDGLADWPEALLVAGEGTSIRLHRRRSGDGAQDCRDVVLAAFQRALAERKSVVFYIHGFGKSFSAALQQACTLRRRFDCIPILFTWPSGNEGGFLSLLGSFPAAIKAAELCYKGLVGALGDFLRVANSYQPVPAVLLVRSLGANTLMGLAASALRDEPTGALERLILSAPACPRKQMDWLARFKCEQVVTVNREDEKLRFAQKQHNGDFLGNQPFDASDYPKGVRLVHLDCTDVNGVDESHDYLLRQVNLELHTLNEQLINGRPIDFAQLQLAGLQVNMLV
ncbi:alkaline phosphatase D family protein [Aquincola sp. S2]|uniref:Alkaline phosphatase D family protein n=1 Tax=Pseudaquabacterium terrae TaxID=2732868 RepID=A0ABX2EK26_9BURK|nr:alkaline phosphatase D family protein [Aquabacterium terrae]NRF69012.1 alkaline phosphatase D family protein [Aquabacterium terrae]